MQNLRGTQNSVIKVIFQCKIFKIEIKASSSLLNQMSELGRDSVTEVLVTVPPITCNGEQRHFWAPRNCQAYTGSSADAPSNPRDQEGDCHEPPPSCDALAAPQPQQQPHLTAAPSCGRGCFPLCVYGFLFSNGCYRDIKN